MEQNVREKGHKTPKRMYSDESVRYEVEKVVIMVVLQQEEEEEAQSELVDLKSAGEEVED
jgi:hypothetical protein